MERYKFNLTYESRDREDVIKIKKIVKTALENNWYDTYSSDFHIWVWEEFDR